MTEADLLRAVRDLAKIHGFLIYHTYRSTRSEPGFPDLVFVRAGRLIFVELKSTAGRVKPDQQDWLNALTECPSVEVYLWRPEHLQDGTVAHTFAGRGRRNAR